MNWSEATKNLDYGHIGIFVWTIWWQLWPSIKIKWIILYDSIHEKEIGEIWKKKRNWIKIEGPCDS